jgi:biopolymer transport protein ExbB
MNGRRSLLPLLLMVVCIACGLALTAVVAQEAPADTEPQAPSASSEDLAPAPEPPVSSPSDGLQMGELPTIEKLFKSSPYINTTILVFSVIAAVMFLYMMMAVTGRGFSPPRFIDNVTKLVLNRQFDQAIHLCQNNSGVFVSSVFQRIVENRDKDHAVLLEIISTEGRRRAEPIWNRVNILSEIGNIAPMLGLLGTVWGMIQVFFTMTEDVAGRRAADLANGIGTAMSTTLFGLIVAIAAGLFYTVLRSRVTAVLAEAEMVCHTLADHTVRVAVDPRLRKIDALADAARQKIALAAAARSTGPAAPPSAGPMPRPAQP